MVPKIDLHNDLTTSIILSGKDIFTRSDSYLTDVWFEGLQILNQFDCIRANEVDTKKIFNVAFPALLLNKTIDSTNKELQYQSYKGQVKIYDDLKEKAKDKYDISFVYHIEGVYFLDEESYSKRIEDFKNDGIKSIGIMWIDDSNLGCGNRTKNDTGLTDLGKRVIKEMISKGFIIDLAHTSYKTFFDILELLPDNYPVMFSHGNINAINENNRNLKDDQILALTERKGVIGLSYVGEFVGNNTVDKWMDHLKYGLDLTSGKGYFASGSDFDGMFGEDLIKDLEDYQKLKYLEERIESVYGKDFVKKYFYDNANQMLTAAGLD